MAKAPMKDRVKPVVKLYCLPRMREAKRKKVFDQVVITACGAIGGYGVQSQNDLIVLFVRDDMEYGLGSEIHIEVDLPIDGPMREMSNEQYQKISRPFAETLKRLFPKARVQCNPYRFDPARSWVCD